MEYGEVNSSLQTSDEPPEWWGPDLTVPVAGDKELYPFGTERRKLPKVLFDTYLNTPQIPFDTPDNAIILATITDREVVRNFMDDTKTEYYITVEWYLDS